MAAQGRVADGADQNDEIGVKAGDTFTPELFEKLLEQEYDKLQQRQQPRRA